MFKLRIKLIHRRARFVRKDLIMQAYKIIRYYANGRHRTIFSSVSLEIAQLHCNSAKTRKKGVKGNTIWFDGYLKI